MSTNESPAWLYLFLQKGEAGQLALERLEVVAVGVALPAPGLDVVQALAGTANIGLRLHQSSE